ncbi:SDR family oxidoreductase [Sphingomonas bacterium]|uniref:SDR family oxidoreductase n=1 Tax=Sphingomonas bacterium TaxID=1895847 RepID=UPI001575F70A|nr:SDR family oxidoreductase [Sphingomonas bacterium]
MRVFVTGATGFVGSAVVPDLLAAGHRVVGLARSDEAAATLVAAGAEVHHGDLRDTDSLRRGAEQADAVIHAAFDHDFANLAASCEMDRDAIEALGHGLAGSGKPLIVTSGLPVIPGRVVTEDDAPPPGAHGMPRVSEQTALALVRHGVHATVVRMPQVHDRSKQGFATYLLAHAREKGMSAYVGDGRNRWPAVHRLDAARLYGHVLERGVAGQCYHAVTETGVSVCDIAEAIGRRLNMPVVSLSAAESASHFGWLDRIARMDVPASSTLTQERVAWAPKEATGFLEDLA